MPDWDLIKARARNRDVPWDELEPSKQSYALMRARGHTREAAAGAVNRSVDTTWNWEQSRWWSPALREAQRQIATDKSGFTALQESSFRALRNALESGDIDAAKYVLDQIHGKATSHTESRSDVRVVAFNADDLMDGLLDARSVFALPPPADDDDGGDA